MWKNGFILHDHEQGEAQGRANLWVLLLSSTCRQSVYQLQGGLASDRWLPPRHPVNVDQRVWQGRSGCPGGGGVPSKTLVKPPTVKILIYYKNFNFFIKELLYNMLSLFLRLLFFTHTNKEKKTRRLKGVHVHPPPPTHTPHTPKSAPMASYKVSSWCWCLVRSTSDMYNNVKRKIPLGQNYLRPHSGQESWELSQDP